MVALYVTINTAALARAVADACGAPSSDGVETMTAEYIAAAALFAADRGYEYDTSIQVNDDPAYEHRPALSVSARLGEDEDAEVVDTYDVAQHARQFIDDAVREAWRHADWRRNEDAGREIVRTDADYDAWAA